MTIREENKLNMYLAVQAICDTHRDKWENIGAFARLYPQFVAGIAQITPASAAKSRSTVGVTEDKQKKRKQMCVLSARAAAALYAFADEKGNPALKVDTDYTYNGLMRLRDNSITIICQNILSHARKHGANLVEYGFDKAKANEIAAAITAYEAIKPQARKIRTETASAGQDLRDIFMQLDELLENRLDKMMEQLESTSAEFYRQNEVDTWPIIQRLSKNYPSLQITLPKADPQTFSMESYLYHSKVQLQSNTWGIQEPLNGQLIAPQAIDMILLPLLTFDGQGYRVGYGKGFYDRFLSRCRKDIIKIGISPEAPVAQISDLNEYDVRMDYCITPEKVWEFA